MMCTKFKLCSSAISYVFGMFWGIPLIYWNIADLVLHWHWNYLPERASCDSEIKRTHRVQDTVNIWCVAARKLCLFVDSHVMIWSCTYTLSYKNSHQHFYAFNTILVPFWQYLRSLSMNLILILVCCGCDTSYIVSVHIHCQASIYTLSLCRGHSWRVRLAKQETLTPPGHLVSPLVCRGPWMSTVVLYCWCHSDSASVLLYFTFLSHLFPLPCGAGSTVPREGFDSSVIMPFSWCVVAVTLPI